MMTAQPLLFCFVFVQILLLEAFDELSEGCHLMACKICDVLQLLSLEVIGSVCDIGVKGSPVQILDGIHCGGELICLAVSQSEISAQAVVVRAGS